MLRKISTLLSLIFVLGLGFAIAAPSTSFAKDPKGNKQQNQNKQVQNKQVQNKQVQNKQQNQNKWQNNQNKKVTVKVNYVYGKKYNGHVWYGHNRHRWRGAWYAYGVGPCWINVDGLWFWNVLACPDY